jgi:hypothetical protein
MFKDLVIVKGCYSFPAETERPILLLEIEREPTLPLSPDLDEELT